jgi:hypothetical protein
MKAIDALIGYLKNKLVSILVLAIVVILYAFLPEGTPFIELIYTAITVLGIIILGPILRLLVFNEAAQYAETGRLTEDLSIGRFTPALVHYWFATFLCYAAPILCIAGITK